MGLSPVRLGARLVFSFSLSAGSGGSSFLFPLTTRPTVAVLPFAPVAVRAGLTSRSLRGGIEDTDSTAGLLLLVVVPCPKSLLLLRGGAEGSNAVALDCDAWPEMVRLWPPLGFRAPASDESALS